MRSLAVFLLVAVSGVARADHPGGKLLGPVRLMAGLGDHHHRVSTKNAEAQRFFDQGLILLYSFNHDEAARSFARAAELDPNLGMAHWGVALAHGPNYNLPEPTKEQRAIGYQASRKALKLIEQAPTPEQDYIRAVSKLFSADPNADRKRLAVAYQEAMAELAKKYPDDLDATVLFAESAMNLRPWKLWTPDGKPAEGTTEVVALLEAVLRRNPNHPGAVHYYIHAIEASPHPEYGLACAQRLGSLVPAAGHMVHMPSHIYMRIGNYAAAAQTNERAIAADTAYFQGREVKGNYAMMYFMHNIHFASAAHCFQGRFADAKKAADLLATYVAPNVAEMPMLEGFLTVPPQVLVRFQRWDDILAAPLPGAKLPLTGATWHFARACAFLAKGEEKKAEPDRQAFFAFKKKIPADAMVSVSNTSQSVFAILEAVLNAKFALVRNDRAKAIELLRQAAEREHALNYAEPPEWFIPVGEALGATLLANGQAAEAEKVFRTELLNHPRSGRSLFGLRESLKAQKKDYAARFVDREFQAAWKNADGKELRLSDY